MAEVSVNTPRRPCAQVVVAVALWLAVLASGLAVAYSTHLSRQLVAELDSLQHQAGDLHIEWGQYLLEQSTWGAFDRVASLATNQLNMHVPERRQVVIVEDP